MKARSMKARSGIGLLVVALLAGTSVVLSGAQLAAADDRAEAKRLVQEGITLLQADKGEEALGRFEQAYTLVPSTKVLFNIGLVQRKLGRNTDAYRTFNRLIAEATADTPSELIANARINLKDLEGQGLRLRVTSTQDGAQVLVDGTDIGTTPFWAASLLAPGKHRVMVNKPGYAPWEAILEGGPGSERKLEAKLVALPGTRVGAATSAGAGTTGAAGAGTTAAPPGTGPTTPGGTTPLPPTVLATPKPPTPAPPPPKRATPIYKRWWFWTIIGAVAVGGAATGAVMATRGGPETPTGTIGNGTFPLR